MGVTIIDNTQTINNATWKVQPDVLASESGIVKENGTIHYIDGRLKYHADGVIKDVGVATDYALTVLGVQTLLPAEGGGAAIGDRYLVLASGVAEWNGFVWNYLVSNTTAATGTLVVNTSLNTTYRWSGSAWVVYTVQKVIDTYYALTVLGVQTLLPAEGGGAAIGDRYLVLASGVAEWNGFVWSYLVANTTAATGILVVDTSSNTTYRYSGSAWVVYTVQSVLDLTLARKTDSYTLVAADNGQVVEMNKATANTLTVPSGVFTAGQQVLITQYGAGQTTIAGSGVTLRSDGGKLKINSRYSSATILFISATEAYVFGNLAL